MWAVGRKKYIFICGNKSRGIKITYNKYGIEGRVVLQAAIDYGVLAIRLNVCLFAILVVSK